MNAHKIDRFCHILISTCLLKGAHNLELRAWMLDVIALHNVVCVLDAILFYMQARKDYDIYRTMTGLNVGDDQEENKNDDAEEYMFTSMVTGLAGQGLYTAVVGSDGSRIGFQSRHCRFETRGGQRQKFYV